MLGLLKKVADWQLAQPAPTNRPSMDDWTYGTLYAGMMALSRVSDVPAYHDAMMAMAQRHHWKPAKRPYDADDYCISQTYLELYARHHAPAMLAPTQARLDYILANPRANSLDFKQKNARDRWWWCDALFMSPPVWSRLSAVTGDPKYLDFMDREWRATAAFLYDTNEHLFFRDSTYFEQREANGRKVFWSRGNGWVMAGLVRVLETMPPRDPRRAFYERRFTEMAERIASLQTSDGLWHSSLLDPESYPSKETSGSSFHAYALAWGIHHGLLKRARYEPVVRRAWAALQECVSPEGKLQFVQPVGTTPKTFDPTHSDVFGVGAFLLAGSEIYSGLLR